VDRNDVDWRGYFSAPVTPFRPDGAVDEAAFREVLARTVADGVHGLLINGSTGEWPTQSEPERRRLAEVAVAEVAGRVPVIVNVTAARPDWAGALARHAEEAGADAVMAAPPPAVRPTFAELRCYYTEVFAQTALPAWLYNFPQDVATGMSVDQISQLADLPTVVGVKQSVGSQREFLRTIEVVGDRLRVFGNLLTRLGVSLIRGGFGGDGHFGSGMLLGRLQPAFFEHVWKGEYDQALHIADLFERLNHGLRGDEDDYNWRYGGMQSSLKAAMNLLGQPGGHPRRPKLAIEDPARLDAIRQVLTAVGLTTVA
jgi:4-hydroxy-tetrahydrodipicolinate synthase